VTSRIYLKKCVVSSCLGSEAGFIQSTIEHFSKNSGITVEKIHAKKSVHGWARKGQAIGFKRLLRGKSALKLLGELKQSNLLHSTAAVNSGTITVGVPVYHQMRMLPFNPVLQSYGLQITLCFAYVGSNVTEKVRSVCRSQRPVSTTEVYGYINQLL
jgi:ribosomal protein L5